MIRKNLIKLLGHISWNTEGIIMTRNWADIVRYLGGYRRDVLGILGRHHDVIPGEFAYYWGRYIGDHSLMRAVLLELGEPEWLHRWLRYVHSDHLIEAALLATGDNKWTTLHKEANS